MKKVSKVLLTIFAVGVVLTLFAGALAFLGYIVALIIGGETATNLSLFIYDEYFPWVIRVCSVSVAFGLIGMYLGKIKSLSLEKEEKED